LKVAWFYSVFTGDCSWFPLVSANDNLSNLNTFNGSSGKWIGDAVQKRHDFIGCGKKIKPTTGDKAMSNSMLYHTFGITSVQHINTLF
jgi:hypothetical protein